MHLELSEDMEASEPPVIEERPQVELGKSILTDSNFIFVR